VNCHRSSIISNKWKHMIRRACEKRGGAIRSRGGPFFEREGIFTIRGGTEVFPSIRGRGTRPLYKKFREEYIIMGGSRPPCQSSSQKGQSKGTLGEETVTRKKESGRLIPRLLISYLSGELGSTGEGGMKMPHTIGGAG